MVKKRFFFAENSVSYLFVFPGVVTMFYIKFIFDVLQFKLRSINYGALSSYIMEKKDSIIESIEDIGIEYEEDQRNRLLPEIFVVVCACKVLQIFGKNIECAVVLLSSSSMKVGNIA